MVVALKRVLHPNLDHVNALLPVLLPTPAASCDAQAANRTLAAFTGPSEAKG